jgi:4-carboxymuconolactone decarboxylase
VNSQHEELLRRLALNDQATVESVLHVQLGEVDPSLGAKTCALVRLASLIALPSTASTYDWCVAEALATGASDEEIVAVLASVAPLIGIARLNRAAVDIAAALGHDVEPHAHRGTRSPDTQSG